MKRTAYIFDMDGTLANVESILHYVVQHKNRDTEDFKKDFEKFHQEAITVPPNYPVVDMLWDALADHDVLVVTARKEIWRAQTSAWLSINEIPHHALFMRDKHDERADYEVKSDILDQISEFWNVLHAVDDNPSIIKLWESRGIPTTKIGNWEPGTEVKDETKVN